MSASETGDGRGRRPDAFAAVIVAAGRGTRLGGDVPKQYRPLGAGTVLSRTLAAFLAHPACARLLVAIHPDDGARYRAATAAIADDRLHPPVEGGATRQLSVLAGLRALAEAPAPPRAVLVHDAARPFVSRATIDAVLAALADADGAIPGVAVADTLKRADADGGIVETVPRDGLFRAQTPQGFRFEGLLAAHEAAARGRGTFTDDAAIAEWAGLAVRIVPGEAANLKITTEEDLVAANAAIRSDPANGPRRVPCTGFGYDVHMLEPGDRVVLGGLEIPHDRRLAGHSDADVALHALTDALFGALAEGDIGSHFPPSDPAWKGATSDRFLVAAAERARARGGEIVHLDLTIVCERPKIGPLREAMRRRIAEIVAIPVERVSVKATTTERLGFTGREEGIAASAVATVLMPIDEGG